MTNSLTNSLYHHLLNLMYAVPAGYRFGCYWTMNEAWHKELERSFCDQRHNPHMQTMLGYRIEIVEGDVDGFPKFIAPNTEAIAAEKGQEFTINVKCDIDADAAAQQILRKVREYRRQHPDGLG